MAEKAFSRVLCLENAIASTTCSIFLLTMFICMPLLMPNNGMSKKISSSRSHVDVLWENQSIKTMWSEGISVTGWCYVGNIFDDVTSQKNLNVSRIQPDLSRKFWCFPRNPLSVLVLECFETHALVCVAGSSSLTSSFSLSMYTNFSQFPFLQNHSSHKRSNRGKASAITHSKKLK